MSDTLACPWCGAESTILGNWDHFWVECSNLLDCNATGPMLGSEDEAIAAWSTVANRGTYHDLIDKVDTLRRENKDLVERLNAALAHAHHQQGEDAEPIHSQDWGRESGEVLPGPCYLPDSHPAPQGERDKHRISKLLTACDDIYDASEGKDIEAERDALMAASSAVHYGDSYTEDGVEYDSATGEPLKTSFCGADCWGTHDCPLCKVDTREEP